MTLTLAPASLSFSLVKDQRHTAATAAGDLEAWLSWLELGGASLETRQSYEWTCAKLLRSFPAKTLGEFTGDDLGLVLRTYPPRSRRVRLAAIRGLFAWAEKTRKIPRGTNPADDLPEIKKHKPPTIDPFTETEVAALVDLPAPDGILMQLLVDTGLRRGEALQLRVRDCQLDRGRLIVRPEGAKGGKDRIVYLPTELIARLRSWFQWEDFPPTAYLWSHKPGGHYVRRDKPAGDTTFMTWWQRCINTAGVRYRKPHNTRHTFATRWRRAGGRAETLQEQLGHESVRTTLDMYVHVDEADIRADLRLVEGVD